MLGTFVATATFVIFYLMTVFTLSWGTRELGFSRAAFPGAADDRRAVFRCPDSAVGATWRNAAAPFP